MIKIDGETLTVEQVNAVARKNEKIGVSEKAQKKIIAGQNLVQELVNKGEALYGITTGIGEFSRIKISKEQSEELQKRIIYSHAAGVGNVVASDIVRATMLLRANVIATGYTGTRLSTLETFIEMINQNVIPVVFEKGSVGTSGDLSPLSQIAEVVIGEGEAFTMESGFPELLL